MTFSCLFHLCLCYSGTVARVLLFNLTGGRDPHGLLKPVMVCILLNRSYFY